MHFTIDTDLAIVGIILGLVAIAMAVSPFAQMIWGRPELKFDFSEFTGDRKMLVCTIKNERVKNRFLRWIGVRREKGELQAFISIKEQGTNKYIAKDISADLHTHVRETGLKVDAIPAFSVGLFLVHCMSDGPVTLDARKNEAIKIP